MTGDHPTSGAEQATTRKRGKRGGGRRHRRALQRVAAERQLAWIDRPKESTDGHVPRFVFTRRIEALTNELDELYAKKRER